MAVARTQTLVQLSDELLERLDSYRAREGRSRSEVVRDAIERYLAGDREAEIDRLIVDAYARQPPEDPWNEQAAKQMISAEPW
jgi:metal-responsive CopG/Arc/MetJ family transcriptional regulator